MSYYKFSKSHKALIPRTIQEALDNPDWKLTVLEKMNVLEKNEIWEIVNLLREK